MNMPSNMLPFAWSRDRLVRVVGRLVQLGCGQADSCPNAWSVIELIWELEHEQHRGTAEALLRQRNALPEFVSNYRTCAEVMEVAGRWMGELPAAFTGSIAFARLCGLLKEQFCVIFVVNVVESFNGRLPALWVSNLFEFRLAQFVHLFYALEGYDEKCMAESIGMKILEGMLRQSRRYGVRKVRLDFVPLENALLCTEGVSAFERNTVVSTRAEVAWANFWLEAIRPLVEEESLEVYFGDISGFIREHCPKLAALELVQDAAERRFAEGVARRNAWRVRTLHPCFRQAAEDLSKHIGSFL